MQKVFFSIIGIVVCVQAFANADFDNDYQLCKELTTNEIFDHVETKSEDVDLANDIEDHYLQKARYDEKVQIVLSAVAKGLAYGTVFFPFFIYEYRKQRQIRAAIITASTLFTGSLVAVNILFYQVYQSVAQIDRFYKNFLQGFFWHGPTSQVFANLKVLSRAYFLKFDAERSKIPLSYQKVIEDNLDLLDRNIQVKDLPTSYSLGLGEIQNSERASREIDTLLYKIGALLRLPRETAPLSFLEIRQKFDKLMKEYSSEVRDVLERLTALIEFNNSFKSLKKSKSIIYFRGAEGTGKRYLARKYAQTLGLPFIELSLVNKKPDEIIGKASTLTENGKATLSVLSEALSSLPKDRRFKNAVIFIKDFDKLLSGNSSAEYEEFFLNLLDPGTLHLYLKDLGVAIDVAQFVYILSGSTQLRSEALRSRTQSLSFGAVERSRRLSIVCKRFSQLNAPAKDENIKTIVDLVYEDEDVNVGVLPLLATVEDFARNRIYCAESVLFDVKCKNFNAFEVLKANTDESWHPMQALDLFEMRLLKEKNQLDSGVRIQLEKHLAYLKSTDFNVIHNPEIRKKYTNYFNNINRLFSLPRSVKDLSRDWSQVEDKLKSSMRNYDHSLQDMVLDMVRNHILSVQSPSEKGLRNIAYFWGDPGTGKTYLAKLLAELTGLDLVHISLADANAESFNKQSSFTDYSKVDFGDGPPRRLMRDSGLNFGISNFWNLEVLSRLSEALVNEGGERVRKNAIIFIDEADKVINQEENHGLRTIFLNFLNPDEENIYLSDLGVRVDISKFLVILAGNKPFTEPAIMDRVQSINFPGFNREQRKSIAWLRFKEFFGGSCSIDQTCFNNENSRENEYYNMIQRYSEEGEDRGSVREILRKTHLYFQKVRNECSG